MLDFFYNYLFLVQAFENWALRVKFNLGLAVVSGVRFRHLSTELLVDQLHAVADAKNWDAHPAKTVAFCIQSEALCTASHVA